MASAGSILETSKTGGRKLKVLRMSAVAVALLVIGFAAASHAVAQGPPQLPGSPSTVPGSPGDDCSHGNSNKPCKPDPQPSHGQDCLDHGVARGNEDHCSPAPGTTTTTTSTTTTEQTTPDTSTDQTTTGATTTPPVTTTASTTTTDDASFDVTTTQTTPVTTTTTPPRTVPPTTTNGTSHPVSAPPTTTTAESTTNRPPTSHSEPAQDVPRRHHQPQTSGVLSGRATRVNVRYSEGATRGVLAIRRSRELPFTGLSLWAFALIGGTALVGGLALRRARR